MVEVIINILNEIIGDDDYTKESISLNELIKHNKDVHDIYLADELQLMILLNKDKFVDFDDCYSVIKRIKSSKEAAL